MAVRCQTQGFILAKNNWAEADQVLTVYTEDFGKLEVLGKAIRKIKSKLRGGAELFYLSEIEFIQGRIRRTLTDAVSIERFENIRKDLEKLKIAYQISEVADNLIRGQEKDQEIFNLLNDLFNKLNARDLSPASYYLIYHYFFWNLLSLLGYRIDLYNCVFCQKKLIPQDLCLDPSAGIICSECFKKNRDRPVFSISPEVIKILRLFLNKDWQILTKLKADASCRHLLESISNKVKVWHN